MKTIVITYRGIVIKDPNLGIGKRAVPGDVVTVNDHDAALLIGMGRAVPYEPPKDSPKSDSPKPESPKTEPEREQEREAAREPKREAQSAPARPERKKE